MLIKCYSLPQLLYLLRISTCLNHPALLEKYDKTVRDGLSKVCNVNFDLISSTQLALPAEMGGLGVSSASLLALPAFLASASGANDFLKTIFSETFEDLSFTKVLENRLNLTNEQESRYNSEKLDLTCFYDYLTECFLSSRFGFMEVDVGSINIILGFSDFEFSFFS